MKLFLSIFLPIFLLAQLDANSQTYSNITYDAGTHIDVQSGADICATDIIINGTFSGSGTICNGPLPVELLSFTYSARKNSITLKWRTAFEMNNSGFDIERGAVTKIGVEQWHKTGFVRGSGTTNEPMQYSFEDRKINTGTYRYRLKQRDYNGSYEYFELGQDVKVEPPVSFSMGQNYPNPSNPKSKIDYEIPVYGRVTIKLYNMLGQGVLSIVNEIKDAGYYTLEFDGTSLASGVYFYRITVDGSGMNFTKTLKMVLVK
jgi:hypothetical protein